MATNLIVLITVFVINLIIGLGVLFSNQKRRINNFFFLVATSMGIWLIARGMALYADMQGDPNGHLVIFIRMAFAATLLIPVSANLLRCSIANENYSLKRFLLEKKLHTFLILSMVIVFSTPLFLRGTRPVPQQMAELIPGPLFISYIISMLIVFTYLFIKFRGSYIILSGIQKVELQFVLLAVVLAVSFGVITDVIVPIFNPETPLRKMTTFAVVIFDLVIAYGITTKRIMNISNIIRLTINYAFLTTFLITSYLLIYSGLSWLLSANGYYNDFVPHLFSAIAVAYSMMPVNGTIQQLTRKLFAKSDTINPVKSIREANAILTEITTLKEMDTQFSNFIKETLKTDRVNLLTLKGTVFSSIPNINSLELISLPTDNIIPQTLLGDSEPLYRNTLNRTFEGSKLKALRHSFADKNITLAAGIFDEDQLVGLMLLGDKINGAFYQSSELEFLETISQQIAVAVKNAQLYTEIQNSKNYNDLLLSNMASGVIAVNKEREITVINPEASRILNYYPRKGTGNNLDILPANLQKVIAYTLDTRNPTINREVKVEGIKSNIKESILRVSSTPIGEGDQYQGVMIIIQDITKSVAMEKQMRRSEKLASVGTLSAGMAHEIKNPLVSLKTFVQLLPERFNDKDFRETFGPLAEKEINRIDSLVNNLLHFAKPKTPELKIMDFHEIIDQTVTLITQQAKACNVAISQELTALPNTINGDIEQIEQVILNLLLNAIEASPNGGHIHIETSNETNKPHFIDEIPFVCMITDTGIGISEDDQVHLFDPFFSTKETGSGLGLAITHGIIEEHNAMIYVDSELAKGTCFTLIFEAQRVEAALV